MTPPFAHKPDLACIGKLLPGLFAVFEEPDFKATYINYEGMRFLDPARPTPLEAVLLTKLIGVNELDRFKREIYPQTKVLGSWKGTVILCDMTGSESACYVKFLEIPASDHRQGGARQSARAAFPSKAPLVSPGTADDEAIVRDHTLQKRH